MKTNNIIQILKIYYQIDSNKCNGVLENPWYCNKARFFEDPRCKYMYYLKWVYNKETSELEITTDYTRNSENEIFFVGLLQRSQVKQNSLEKQKFIIITIFYTLI